MDGDSGDDGRGEARWFGRKQWEDKWHDLAQIILFQKERKGAQSYRSDSYSNRTKERDEQVVYEYTQQDTNGSVNRIFGHLRSV